MREFTPGMIYVHGNNGTCIEFKPGYYDDFSQLIADHKLKVDTINKITRAMRHMYYGKFWAQIFTDTPICGIAVSTASMDAFEVKNPNCHIIIQQFGIYSDMIINSNSLEIGFHDGFVRPEKLSEVMLKSAAYLSSQYKPFMLDHDSSVPLIMDDGDPNYGLKPKPGDNPADEQTMASTEL